MRSSIIKGWATNTPFILILLSSIEIWLANPSSLNLFWLKHDVPLQNPLPAQNPEINEIFFFLNNSKWCYFLDQTTIYAIPIQNPEIQLYRKCIKWTTRLMALNWTLMWNVITNLAFSTFWSDKKYKCRTMFSKDQIRHLSHYAGPIERRETDINGALTISSLQYTSCKGTESSETTIWGSYHKFTEP